MGVILISRRVLDDFLGASVLSGHQLVELDLQLELLQVQVCDLLLLVHPAIGRQGWTLLREFGRVQDLSVRELASWEDQVVYVGGGPVSLGSVWCILESGMIYWWVSLHTETTFAWPHSIDTLVLFKLLLRCKPIVSSSCSPRWQSSPRLYCSRLDREWFLISSSYRSHMCI